MSLTAKIAHWRQVITVEPLLVIFILVSNTHLSVFGDRNNFFKNDIYGLDSSISIKLVQTIIPILLAFFFGSCSDKFKARKPFLLVPIFGEFVSLFGYTLCKLFESRCPKVLSVLFYCLPSCFGGRTVFYMAALAYIADANKSKELPFRLGVLFLTEYLSIVIHRFQYAILFSSVWLVLCFALVGTLYASFWLQESIQHFSIALLVKSALNPNHIWQTLTVFRKYVCKKSVNVLALLYIIFIYRLANYGGHFILFVFSPLMPSLDVYYLPENDFFALIFSVGILFLIPLLTKALHVANTKLLILSFVFQILSNLLIATTAAKHDKEIRDEPLHTSWMYLASFTGIFTVFTSFVSVASALQTVSPEDFGKFSALIAIFDTAGLSVTSAIVDNFFQKTFDFAYVGAVLFLGFLPIIVWMHIDYQKISAPVTTFDNLTGNNEEECEELNIQQ